MSNPNQPVTPAPAHENSAAQPLLVAESGESRYLIGHDILDRATGKVVQFLAISPDEADMIGYVEHVEKGYDGTEWYARRVYRTTVSPDDLAAYIGLVEKIHDVYRHLVLDTDEDRALHARHIENADQALTLVKDRLGLNQTDTTDGATTDG